MKEKRLFAPGGLTLWAIAIWDGVVLTHEELATVREALVRRLER